MSRIFGDRQRRRRERSTRRARNSKGARTAFVLGGGGVLGAVQVGHLEALLRAGITPDLIVGTSVGALNGAALAARPTLEGVQCLRDVWFDLKRDDLFPGSRLARAWYAVKANHLCSNGGLRKLIDKVAASSFEALEIPLSVCAANLRTGTEHWFESGPLEPAVLASSAIPGVYPPVLVDGESFVDGGVVNQLPISRAIELGATTVYVITCGTATTARVIRRPLDVLLQSFAHARAQRIHIDRARFDDHARIIEMPSVDTSGIGYDDLRHTERLYREALEASSAFLATPVTA
jgi:NTE family protein